MKWRHFLEGFGSVLNLFPVDGPPTLRSADEILADLREGHPELDDEHMTWRSPSVRPMTWDPRLFEWKW